MNPDVIIIGAGAAGMMAALKLAEKGKKVMVLEALRRTGGRMFTVEDTATGQAVEMGAEFVHGDLSLTKELLEEAGAQLYKITGHIWQFRNGALEQDDANEDFDSLLPALKSLDQDLPVATFIEQHVKNNQPEELTFSLRGYIEGYYAADTERSSSFALRDELDREEEPQYRIEGGYRLLVQHLEAQCRKSGVQFFLEEKVNQVLWQEEQVTVITGKGPYNAPKVLITVSVGVLQSDAIAFEPQLPEYKAAAQALGFGHVVKISLLFKQPFWKEPRLTRGKDLHDIQFMFSEEAVPTWWSQHPKEDNLLTGWLAGPKAVALKNDSHEALLQKALDSLSHIFGLEPAYLWQDLLGAWSHNWSDDPHFNGAYSYEVVNGAAHQQVLLRPVANTLYFAGEGLHHGPEIGTVEAALISGKEAAERMVEGGE